MQTAQGYKMVERDGKWYLVKGKKPGVTSRLDPREERLRNVLMKEIAGVGGAADLNRNAREQFESTE
jgi:hypothetical protein